MGLTKEQTELLREPLIAENVQSRKGAGSQQLKYIAGFHAINEANRIFGFDGWTTQIEAITELNRAHYVKKPYRQDGKEEKKVSVAYMCRMRLTVGGCVREDVGFGDGIGPDTPGGLHSAIELATKECVTDAIKRCLRSFGDQFGNSLYEKDALPPIDYESYEASKPVTSADIDKLRTLMAERAIDDSWVVAWMRSNGFDGDISDLRNDLYQSMVADIDNIGKEERERKEYTEKFDKLIDLIRSSVNENMLKGVFKEAWVLCSRFDDKERQVEAHKEYEAMKKKLGGRS